MSLEEYRTVFLAASLALIMIVAFPTLSKVMFFHSSQERFSELWILGPNYMAEDYPFNVQANETYRVFVGVENHEDYSAYYMVYVKFRNGTQLLPNSTVSKPSSLSPPFEFRFLVADGQTWKTPITFAILDASLQNDCMFVGNVSINDVVFSVNSFSMWDPENNGFYYQLFFELWLYDMTSHVFQYHNRFAGIWLNVTSS